MKDPPVVFSFGSNGNQLFELDLLKLRPDARISIFEIKADRLPVFRHPQIRYHAIGLGGYEHSNDFQNNLDKDVAVMMPLRELMQRSNVTRIDILKMDIEGFEFAFVKNEMDLFSRIGQFLVEVHIKRSKSFFRPEIKEDAVWFVEQLESHNMRLFSSEPNSGNVWGAIEFSLIQREWTSWQAEMHKLGGGQQQHHNQKHHNNRDGGDSIHKR